MKMDNTCCLSFYDERHVEFSFKEYPILYENWYNQHFFGNIFHILDMKMSEQLADCAYQQLDLYLKNYEAPLPSNNSRFGYVKNITLDTDGTKLMIDLSVSEHFKIHMLNDIYGSLKESLVKLKESYIIPRNSFLNEYHLSIIYRIKYLIGKGVEKRTDIEKSLLNEFLGNVSVGFINSVITSLNDLQIVNNYGGRLLEGKYLRFFY